MATKAPYASVALIWRDQQVLILKRYGGTSQYPGYWCLPGGHMEKGETPFEAARREIKEETGFDLPAGELEPLLTIRGVVVYEFRDNPWATEVVLSEENTEFQWLRPQQALSHALMPVGFEVLEHVIQRMAL